MPSLFTPNHVQLIAACYPPSAALLNAGPDYRPNAQELSRMTYYASNRPGKINKLSGELERRVRVDCRKAQAGNLRARASLLVTLAMFKALAAECRRDVSLLSPSLLASINVTLSSLSSDLEVAARAASVFSAWTTYTDGHLIGVDRYVTEEHMSCLQVFSSMGKIDSSSLDHEIRNRTRLLGLAAILGVVTSEVLYYSSTQFKPQISTLVPALLIPLFNVEVPVLEEESTDLKEQAGSPYLDGVRERPAIERRATSIHVHVDGDKGPSSGDVANSSLRALSTLFGHANANQAAMILQAAFDCFDDTGSWDKVEHCRWFAEKASEWTQYQYRYAVPSRLVECLVEGQDAPHSTSRHIAAAAMVKTVFTSPTPLVNLSTSDIISNLITLVFRRVVIDTEDPLLPALVECISSLGTHVYYADQIHDLASELVSRLVLVESSGLGGGRGSDRKGRAQAVRCLLAGLLGLMHAADMHEAAKEEGFEELKARIPGPSAAPSSPVSKDVHIKPSRRTKVSPEIWQDTVAYLCDADYSVRSDYAGAVISYLKKEVPKFPVTSDTDIVRRSRSPDGSARQAITITSVIYGDPTTRLLHALHAHLYVLATSTALGFVSTPSTSTTPGDSSPANTNQDSPPGSQGRRSTTAAPRSRKSSVTLKLLQNAPKRLSMAASASASLSDYSSVLAVLSTIQENLPIRGLLTGIPMLLALDGACQCDTSVDPIAIERICILKQIIARVWLSIGKTWDCSEVIVLAEKALSSVALTYLPVFEEAQPGVLRPPQSSVPFVPINNKSTDIRVPTVDSEGLLMSIVSHQKVQDTTGLDRQGLLRRLADQWTPETAFVQSVETQTSFDGIRNDSLTPLVRVSPALMEIENNMSLQSLARSTRGVGVTDLREALEGRGSMSNPHLPVKAPSLSTLDHTSMSAHGELKLTPIRSRPHRRNRLGGSADVKDVLNRLGIGRQNGNGLKSPFPALQRPQSRPKTATTPPYKR